MFFTGFGNAAAAKPKEPVLAEYLLFLLLGCIGGVVGAAFVHLNMKVHDDVGFRREVSPQQTHLNYRRSLCVQLQRDGQ